MSTKKRAQIMEATNFTMPNMTVEKRDCSWPTIPTSLNKSGAYCRPPVRFRSYRGAVITTYDGDAGTSGPARHELRHVGQEEAIRVTPTEEDLPSHPLPAHAQGCLLFFLEGHVDGGDLIDDIRVVRRETAELAEDLEGLLALADADEVAR
jgi:hypothetical protein